LKSNNFFSTTLGVLKNVKRKEREDKTKIIKVTLPPKIAFFVSTLKVIS